MVPPAQSGFWPQRAAAAVAFLVTAVVVLAISNSRIGRTSRELALALGEKDGALAAAQENEANAKKSAAEAVAQRKRAEAGESQARSAVDQFLTKVSEDRLLQAPGSQALRRDLLRSALLFYEEFLKQHADDPSLMAALAGVHLKVGTIQSDLGDWREASRSFQAARKIYTKLASATPDDRAILNGLATVYFRNGDNVRAADIWEKLHTADPAEPAYRRDLADVYNSLAIQRGHQKSSPSNWQFHQQGGAALREGLERDFPDNVEYKMALGSTLNNLGVVLAEGGRSIDALAMYMRSVGQGEAAFARARFDVMYGRFLGVSYGNVANSAQFQNLGRC